VSFIPNQCKVETLQAFIAKTKCERYVGFISNEKRRGEFVRQLAHFNDFDPRWIIRIAPSSQSPEGIHTIFKAHGAPEHCHAISEFTELDGKELRLIDALKRIVGSQMGTILCCNTCSLAYFENEDTRYILERHA
jgi:hypothetical protein